MLRVKLRERKRTAFVRISDKKQSESEAQKLKKLIFMPEVWEDSDRVTYQLFHLHYMRTRH